MMSFVTLPDLTHTLFIYYSIILELVMLRSQIIRSSVGFGFVKFGLGSVSVLQYLVSVGFGRFVGRSQKC